MNFPFASMTESPFFGMSLLFWMIEVMWSPSILMAAFGMIFPVPGSIAVPLTMSFVPEGVANAVAARVTAQANRRRRFIYIMSGRDACSIVSGRAWKASRLLEANLSFGRARLCRAGGGGASSGARQSLALPICVSAGSATVCALSGGTTMHWRILTLSLAIAMSAHGQTATPSTTTTASAKHPFTFEDMMKLKRVGAPVPSPDGKWVVFDCEDVDLEPNRKISHLWIVPAKGGDPSRLNPTPNHDERPRCSPDGKQRIWTSKPTDLTQIWICDFDTGAGMLVGQPHQVTNISTGADGAIWSPDGKNIVFVSAVYPECADDACNKHRDDELKKSKVKAKVFTRLFHRHWNTYTEFKRSHLFVVGADVSSTDTLSVGTAGVSPAESSSEGVSTTASQTPDKMSGGPTGKMPMLRKSEPRDLTPGDHDVPPFHLGGQDMYAISPDGQEVAYTSNIDEVEATSTNNEIFIVPMAGGTPKKISTSPGSDSTPLYSPNGKYIAWRSQARAGFEADKWRLVVRDRQLGETRDLTEKLDRSVENSVWW